VTGASVVVWDGHATNGALVFDWRDAETYRFAQLRQGAGEWSLAERVNGTVTHQETMTASLSTGVPYTFAVVVEGSVATLLVSGTAGRAPATRATSSSGWRLWAGGRWWGAGGAVAARACGARRSGERRWR
jgi:hypothetical protein